MMNTSPDLSGQLQKILATPTPLLPREELHGFVQYYFNLQNHYLAVLETHPGPLYLQESAVLKKRALQMKTAFRQVLPRVAFYYAVKSNNHPDIARVLMEAEFGLDVSSGLELEMALGIGARDIVFSGPGKTDKELQLAVAHSDRVVVLLDSFGELHRLEGIAAALKKNICCGVRLTVNPEGLWRKFGILLQELPSFWDEAGKCPHIRLTGLQFHASWNLSPAPQVAFIRSLGKMIADMPVSFKAR